MRWIAIILLLISSSVFGKIEISLLTTTPGDQPHTIFGHTAIRLIDSENEVDQVFNYGLVNFNQPFFPIMLLHGTTDYWLGVQSIRKFKEINNRERRFIHEQKLDLSAAMSEAIASTLRENAKSENKFYRYSFTQKNCATPVRDLLGDHGLMPPDQQADLTYRELLHQYIKVDGWYQFGIHLILGTMAEQKMTLHQTFFVPERLERAVHEVPGLVSETNTLNEVIPPEMGGWNRFFISPLFIFSILTLISLKYRGKWMKVPLFILIGSLGSFLLYITLVTEHVELMNNFNVLWCNPLFVLLGVVLIFSDKTYLLSLSILTCISVSLLMYLLNIQKFDLQIIPLLICLCILLRDEIVKRKSVLFQ